MHAKAPPISASLGSDSEVSTSQEVKRELVERYQRVVNDSQLPRLNAMIGLLDEEIFTAHLPPTYVVIDDLDKDWIDTDLSSLLIRSLFLAVLDMTRMKRVKILIAIRSNIFDQLNYGSDTLGGQGEKVRGHGLPVQWTDGDLRSLLKTRAEVAAKLYGFGEGTNLGDLLPKPSKGAGPSD